MRVRPLYFGNKECILNAKQKLVIQLYLFNDKQIIHRYNQIDTLMQK
jgi:hypothetical protein